MAKAKKAITRAARPAKKAVSRKVAKKPQPKNQKKAAPAKATSTVSPKAVSSRSVRKPVAKKKAARRPKPAAAPAPAVPAAPAATVAAVRPRPPATRSTPSVPATPAPPVPSAVAAPGVVPDALSDIDAGAARKKGVRKATITSGLQETAASRRLGRSRIPVDAPLDVVFQNDTQARDAFSFLGIHSIRELEAFTADDLVLRLTGPAKLTVGRIRKILAMNNRCLTGDEDFAVEFQDLHSRVRPE